MKVCLINAVVGYGSTGRLVSNISHFLKMQGDECVILYGEKKTSYEGSLYVGNFFDHKLHALLHRVTGLNGYFSTLATKKVIKFLKKYKPDLIHFHNLHSNFLNIPLLLKFINDESIPLVISLHDCFFFTGYCMHYFSYNCNKWKTCCQNCPAVPFYIPDRSRKMFVDKKNILSKLQNLAIIGNSKWGLEDVNLSFLANAKIKDYIYSWVDFSIFKIVESKFKSKYKIENKFVVLCVASLWSQNKGILDIAKLSQILPQNMQIVIVGNISSKYQKMINNAIYINETNNINELVDIYNAADAFFMASHQETFGMVGAESLGCGTPVIGFNVTAIPEVIGDKCGYVVELGDVNGVLESLMKIQKNGKQFYSKNCANFAKQSFSIENSTKKIYEIYKNLIKERIK